MQVTISVLPVSLSLVHVPRSRLTPLSHPILRQILQPSPAFLNITCNDIELSIFTDDHMLQDFESIARKDRQRQRSRSGSGSIRKSSLQQPLFRPVELSYEKWSVLQIDSHSDRLDNSGTRVFDLSAPLADAGISILYQSSYMSDFIFVKESRLREVMRILASVGFHLYSPDSNYSISPSLSPITNDELSFDFPPSPAYTGGAVLTRNLTDTLKSDDGVSEIPQSGGQSPRSKSRSPTSGEVRLLDPDLACVGLSDEFGVDHWGLKIVKLVAFPDLISGSASAKKGQLECSDLHSLPPPIVDFTTNSIFSVRGGAGSDTSSSSSDDDDGYFSHSPQSTSLVQLPSHTSRSCTSLQSSTCPSLHKTPSKHFVANIPPLSPIVPKQPTWLVINPSIMTDSTRPAPKPECHVPFFSFTRTPEGSSLTADVHLLATLFPPHERHMVICSGELDTADLQLQGGDSSDEEDDDASGGQRFLKCLQIDLRRFGLDKHGLVNRFSRVLEENKINHMYSSTFKTANLLVEKRDAPRAQSLLRAC